HQARRPLSVFRRPPSSLTTMIPLIVVLVSLVLFTAYDSSASPSNKP
ncbi:MAG: hypothetical protein JWM88_2227, partial [Verrucomicrobia bacterium]|nr:hypothetical protein [Verrucomicrobiota bacterium]